MKRYDKAALNSKSVDPNNYKKFTTLNIITVTINIDITTIILVML